MNTTVQCFGLRRLLADTAVLDVWVWRELEWSDVIAPTLRSRWTLATGSYDTGDFTRKGVKISGLNQFSVTTATQVFAVWWLKGVTITRLLGTYEHKG